MTEAGLVLDYLPDLLPKVAAGTMALDAALDTDAEPGDLGLQLLPIRWRSSSNQSVTI